MTSSELGRRHPIHRKYRQGKVFANKVAARAEIAAAPEIVWRALVDFERYAEWNRFTPRVETDLAIGSPITLHVEMPGKSRMVRTEWINLVEPGETLCWGMHMGHPGLLCANRWQVLRPLDNGHTEYLTEDKMSGLLTPLVMALYGRAMQQGFQLVADGLKHWIETGKPLPKRPI